MSGCKARVAVWCWLSAWRTWSLLSPVHARVLVRVMSDGFAAMHPTWPAGHASRGQRQAVVHHDATGQLGGEQDLKERRAWGLSAAPPWC